MSDKPLSEMSDDEIEASLAEQERAGFVKHKLGPNGEKLWYLTDKGAERAKHLIATNGDARDFFNRLKPS